MLLALTLLAATASTATASDAGEAPAAAPDSCSVSLSGERRCNFSCHADREIGASADASKGSVAISGSCGGGSVGCETQSQCKDTDVAKTAGVGICEITEAGTFDDEGSGSCYGQPPPRGRPPTTPECTIKIGSICIWPQNVNLGSMCEMMDARKGLPLPQTSNETNSAEPDDPLSHHDPCGGK